MSRQTDIYGVTCEVLNVGAGPTFAQVVVACQYEVASVLKYASGGSLVVMGCPPGSTHTGATITFLTSRSYLMDVGEALNFDGANRYYVVATGATAVAYVMHTVGSPG